MFESTKEVFLTFQGKNEIVHLLLKLCSKTYLVFYSGALLEHFITRWMMGITWLPN